MRPNNVGVRVEGVEVVYKWAFNRQKGRWKTGKVNANTDARP